MVIEAECRLDAELFDNHFARAIGETPSFISESPDYVPRCSDFVGRKIVNGCQLAGKEARSRFESLLRLIPGAKQGERLVDDEIGADECLIVRGEPACRGVIIRIVRDKK